MESLLSNKKEKRSERSKKETQKNKMTKRKLNICDLCRTKETSYMKRDTSFKNLKGPFTASIKEINSLFIKIKQIAS